MGQYLAIGLATQVGVKKTNLNKANFSLEQLQDKMQHDLYYAPELYVACDHEKFHLFQIKDEIFHAQLIPFLQTLYPLLYKDTADYDSIIPKLQTTPPAEWLPWAAERPEEAFQLNELSEYDKGDYLRAKYTSIPVYYECLLLSMEGKIAMETYGRQFNFIKYTMMQTFKQFSLSGALRIYITG